MIDRHGDRPERDAVQPVGQEECAAAHVLQREIGAQHLLVERILLFAHLLGVVPPVPRLERRTGLVALQQFVHLRQLGLGAVERRRPDLVEQRIDRLGRPGHLVGHHVVGIGVVAQHAGLLRTQPDEIVDQLLVVVRIAVVAAVQIGLVDPFAQVAPRRVGQERNQAGLVQREDPFVLAAHRFGLLLGGIADSGGQPLQIAARQLQHESVVLGQDVVAVLHADAGQLFVDLLQALFLRIVEQGARPHERVVGLLQQPALLGIEPERRTPVVDLLDFGEETLVEQDAVGVGRQQGGRLRFDGLHPLVGLRGAEHPEDQFGPGQHPPRSVVSQNHVLERGRIVVRHDGVDLGRMERHAALEGRHEMLRSDPVERRHPVRSVPFGEKGIFIAVFHRFATAESHNRKQ